jgi:hypothetical protein
MPLFLFAGNFLPHLSVTIDANPAILVSLLIVTAIMEVATVG